MFNVMLTMTIINNCILKPGLHKLNLFFFGCCEFVKGLLLNVVLRSGGATWVANHISIGVGAPLTLPIDLSLVMLDGKKYHWYKV